jgi:hypothetical protein
MVYSPTGSRRYVFLKKALAQAKRLELEGAEGGY